MNRFISYYRLMCGRYTYRYTWKQLHKLLDLLDWPKVELRPRYNVAPTQDAPIVRVASDGRREGVMMRWGFTPSWASDPIGGNLPINARAETIGTSPLFRDSFARRRCLVPMTGFYEWRQTMGDPKQPYWIGRKDREPFVLAGVWDSWTRADESVDSFAIITTTPNPLMAGLHDRMPVILEPGEYASWLDPTSSNPQSLVDLLRPSRNPGFEAYPVSTRVNSPRNDDPSLEQRIEPEPQSLFE
jgi:putative SOS response-associated peptidase YedK